ncbi:MAG: hypothetical protein KGH75_00905 [Rhodospirillales bacterium]|nr:hypothetical protein [Rhodospirillales bacterium]
MTIHAALLLVTFARNRVALIHEPSLAACRAAGAEITVALHLPWRCEPVVYRR